jgi:hypothetical protein
MVSRAATLNALRHRPTGCDIARAFLEVHHTPAIGSAVSQERCRRPHGSVKQIHREELEDGNKERPGEFAQIMLKQTDSGIQQLHGASERTKDQQR